MSVFLSLVAWVRHLPTWLVASGITAGIFLFPVNGLAAPPSVRVIRIEAERFAYHPAQLRVNPGDQVTFEVVAQDVAHGIAIDGYNLEVLAEPGQTAHLTFTADRPGTFRFRCPVTCGPLHPFMLGKLVVGTNWLLVKAGIASLGIILLGLVSRTSGKKVVHG